MLKITRTKPKPPKLTWRPNEYGRAPDEPKFDVAVNRAARECGGAEEDEESKRKREAELASTFDQPLAHHGKTEEEMIEERQAEARLRWTGRLQRGLSSLSPKTKTTRSWYVEEAVPPDEDAAAMSEDGSG